MTQRAIFIGGASFSCGAKAQASRQAWVGDERHVPVRILGYSFSGVERVALDLKERLTRIPRVREVNINAGSFFGGGERAFAVTLEPDRAALARFGVTSQD